MCDAAPAGRDLYHRSTCSSLMRLSAPSTPIRSRLNTRGRRGSPSESPNRSTSSSLPNEYRDGASSLASSAQGQEIHIGEEGGLVQWRQAVEGAANPGAWSAPAHLPAPAHI